MLAKGVQGVSHIKIAIKDKIDVKNIFSSIKCFLLLRCSLTICTNKSISHCCFHSLTKTRFSGLSIKTTGKTQPADSTSSVMLLLVSQVTKVLVVYSDWALQALQLLLNKCLIGLYFCTPKCLFMKCPALLRSCREGKGLLTTHLPMLWKSEVVKSLIQVWKIFAIFANLPLFKFIRILKHITNCNTCCWLGLLCQAAISTCS